MVLLHACAHNPTGVDPKVGDLWMDEVTALVLMVCKFQEIPILSQKKSLEILRGREVSKTS